VTFKHVLLPLWVGTYRYRGRQYPVLINGQTGKVSGEKPRDAFIVFGFAASTFFTLLLITLVVIYLAFHFGWVGR
jgi:hypothetical protein